MSLCSLFFVLCSLFSVLFLQVQRRRQLHYAVLKWCNVARQQRWEALDERALDKGHPEGKSNAANDRYSGVNATEVREDTEHMKEHREDREDTEDREDREELAEMAEMAERMAQLTADNEELTTLHKALKSTHARDMQLLRSRAVAAQQSFDRRIVQLQHQIKREREDFRRELDGIRSTSKKREAAWRGTALTATKK